MSVKPYRVVAKVKNNRLWRAIMELWPDCKTQTEAAKHLDVDQGHLGTLLNMKRWPASEKDGEIRWRGIAKKISKNLAREPGYLFDPKLYGKELNMPRKLELEIGIKELENRGVYQLPPPPEEIINAAELEDKTRLALASLKPREQLALMMRYGMDEEGKEKSCEEIGKILGIGRSRAAQVVARAQTKLRYHDPFGLRKFVDDAVIIPEIDENIKQKRRLEELKQYGTEPERQLKMCKYVDVYKGRCTFERRASGFCYRHQAMEATA